MKLNVAVAALLPEFGASSSWVNMKNVPNDAFAKIPSLVAKDRKHRAELSQKLAKAAEPKLGTRLLNDGQAEQTWNQYVEYWNQDMVVEEFGFDIDHYSIKYTGCKVAKGWDDAVAENQNFDTVLGQETFVTFRLCPTDKCEGQNGYPYGCSENYGEYMLKLDEYVEALTNYREKKKQTFCEYCEVCAAMKGYKAWNAMMQGSVQAIATQVEKSFELFYENWMASNGYSNSNGGQYQYEIKAKQAYNKAAKNMANDAAANQGQGYQGDNMYGAYGNYKNNINENVNNDYANNAFYNYNGYTSFMDMQKAIGNFRQYWNYQNEIDKQNNYYQQGADWMNIDSQYPTFLGKPVLTGYYTNNGQFIEQIGYFNSDGDWYSFEPKVDGNGNKQGLEPFMWDESAMGEIPYSWDLVQGNDPDVFEECDYQYSSSCQTAFQECQFTLHYDDMQGKYTELLKQAKNYGDSSNVYYQLQLFEQSYAKQSAEKKFSEALMCQPVEYYADETEDDLSGSDYANQQNYEELYNQQQQYAQNLQACGNDQDCQAVVQENMKMNNKYQLWIIESAWEEYKKYKQLNAQYYVGATCKSDGFGIELQIFSDENCAVEHPSATVEEILGESLELSYDLVTAECIPCNDNQFALEAEFEDGYGQNDFGGILPFCSMLYQVSAKCNQHLTPNRVYNAEGFYMDGVYYSPSYDLMYGSEQQQEQEKKICSMIESLNSGTYKEDGSITLGQVGWLSPSHWKNEVASASSGMPKATKSIIFVLVVLSSAMGLWAMVLQGALRRRQQQLHPEKDRINMARQESGIVMGRSRSGPAVAPLV